MNLELQWFKERDERTTEVIHTMFDPISGREVATIRKVPSYRGKQWQVQIKTNVPWHRKSLKIAKKDCEWIYTETVRSKKGVRP